MSPTDSLPDEALRTLGRLLHAALHCAWLALTPLRDDKAFGPRRTLELTIPGRDLRSGPADVLGSLLSSPAARLFQLPDDRLLLPANLVPAGCRAYLLRPLQSAGERVGMLELAWREPRPDPDLRALDDLLPLLTLLADHRSARPARGTPAASCPICAASCVPAEICAR